MWSRIVARHCVTCVGCTPYSLANCEAVLSPTRASNPTLALKAALCRLRFAFIVCFLCSSRPAKVHLNQWSSFWGPPHIDDRKIGKRFIDIFLPSIFLPCSGAAFLLSALYFVFLIGNRASERRARSDAPYQPGYEAPWS